MLTPAIAAIKKRYPDAEIDFAASSWVEKLLTYMDHINMAVIYDMAFLAHRYSFYGLVSKIAGIRYRPGFSETEFLMHTSEYDEEVHFVNRYLIVLDSIGIKSDNSSLSLKRLENRNDVLRKIEIGRITNLIQDILK